ncbi:hypothetical protein FHS90_004467 [Rufibacter quisquiliarum]|uniref:Uncharacterized protein n=1 Tax=Rufibacter quisquiliarum TaxID=1549639 RepID=A0A839GY20_9BACT|nr:hypothetical protein [Rufibacter quisquiliarum]
MNCKLSRENKGRNLFGSCYRASVSSHLGSNQKEQRGSSVQAAHKISCFGPVF